VTRTREWVNPKIHAYQAYDPIESTHAVSGSQSGIEWTALSSDRRRIHSRNPVRCKMNFASEHRIINQAWHVTSKLRRLVTFKWLPRQ
jgi:hypothetical protein